MPENLFRVRGLRKRFPDGTEALRDVSFDIHQGECLLIAGSNGSGKTLLMRMLVALAQPSSGSIEFRGAEVRLDPLRVRRAVGLVFQDADAQIVGETVAEDVSFGPRNVGLNESEVNDRTRCALEATGLADKADQAPRRLSGGEKRRLAIAGILAMGAEAVIMDEPFANLDWPGIIQVLRSIEDLKRSGATVVVLTHELEKVLAHADRMIVLDKGLLRDEGTPYEVLARGVGAYGIRDPRHAYARVEDCTWLT